MVLLYFYLAFCIRFYIIFVYIYKISSIYDIKLVKNVVFRIHMILTNSVLLTISVLL